MNRGVYGTVCSADINIKNDAEVLYNYRPSRGGTDSNFGTDFKVLDDSDKCLVKSTDSEGSTVVGMYELKLPVDKFSKTGIYTVYVRPKEIKCKLSDVSTLASYPDVKGVIIASSSVNGITDLTGYRIEYLDGSTRRDEVRVITSCNTAEPVLVTVTDAYSKVTRWRLTDSSSDFLFCTVTPSTSNTFNPNSQPFIGYAGCDVVLTNTKFNPVMMEIEMVDDDMSTIANMLQGDQIRDRDNGLITTYDKNHQIYHQYEYYTLKDELNKPMYDVKIKKEIPDTSQSWDNIISNNE